MSPLETMNRSQNRNKNIKLGDTTFSTEMINDIILQQRSLKSPMATLPKMKTEIYRQNPSNMSNYFRSTSLGVRNDKSYLESSQRKYRLGIAPPPFSPSMTVGALNFFQPKMDAIPPPTPVDRVVNEFVNMKKHRLPMNILKKLRNPPIPRMSQQFQPSH